MAVEKRRDPHGERGPEAFTLPSSEGGGIRSAFLIDGEGVVRKVFAKVRVDGHAQEVLAALSTL